MKYISYKKLNKCGYDYLIVCLNYDSVLTHIKEIEHIIDKDYEGKILVDQLLSSGNGINRFIECDYGKGKININTFKNAIVTDDMRKESEEIMKSHPLELLRSILPKSMKDKIIRGELV